MANRVYGRTVPTVARPAPASGADVDQPAGPGPGTPSVTSAIGAISAADARNWAALTAITSCPGNSRAWTIVKPDPITTDSSTRPSPTSDESPPPDPATTAIPASDRPNPTQATARTRARSKTTARTATSTGTAPTS